MLGRARSPRTIAVGVHAGRAAPWSLVSGLALAFALAAGPTSAHAEAPAPPASRVAVPMAAPTPTPAPAPRPSPTMRQPERLTSKPSGFWTSNRKSQGGAYRWRIMLVGALVLAIAAVFTIRALRRIERARTAKV